MERREIQLRRRLVRATGAATIVLVGLLAAVGYTVVDIAHATKWIEHSHQVRASLQRLLQSLVDAETGQRGYLVTGDRKFLEPYALGRAAWRSELAHVRQLTADDPPQLERAAAFERTASAVLDELDQGVRRHDAGEPAAALTPLVHRAKESMDQLRGIVEDMEADEAECVIERQNDAAKRFHTLLLFTIAAAAASLLVVGTLWLQRRDFEQRASAARRLHLLVDRLPGLAWTSRPDGRIDYCSAQFAETFGLTLDDMADAGWLRTVHPDDAERVRTAWAEAMRTEAPYVQQARQRHVGGAGEYRWYLARANPVRDEHGAVAQWVGCLTDIDDIRRLGDEVAQARALADAVIDNAPLGVAVLDPNLRFSRVNPRLCELNGIAPEAHLGRTPMELLQMPNDQVVEEAKVVLASGRPLATEIDSQPARGSRTPRTWRVHWFPVVVGGKPSALGSILEEITERKSLEAARDANDRFRETFVAMLGHDLRTPLQAMLTSAGLVKRRATTIEARRSAEQIERSGRRMAKMIEQLLDLTRARLAGGIPIHRQRTDLARLVTLAVEEAEQARPTARIHFEIEGCTEGAWDEDRLCQVLSNLLGNAIDHGEGSPVHILVRGDDEGVALHVANGGKPIPPDLVAHVFDPFRRGAREGQVAPSGLGLGLYISEQLVRAHGGTIRVTSNAEEGTRFEVWLPYAGSVPAPAREVMSAQA